MADAALTYVTVYANPKLHSHDSKLNPLVLPIIEAELVAAVQFAAAIQAQSLVFGS